MTFEEFWDERIERLHNVTISLRVLYVALFVVKVILAGVITSWYKSVEWITVAIAAAVIESILVGIILAIIIHKLESDEFHKAQQIIILNHILEGTCDD